MNNSEEKQNPKTPPPLNGAGWIALICGISTNAVLYYGTDIFLATHNAGMPPTLIFLLVISGWGCAFIALDNRKYVLAILGIVFSLPSVAVFLWFVCCYVIPYYVQSAIGGG